MHSGEQLQRRSRISTTVLTLLVAAIVAVSMVGVGVMGSGISAATGPDQQYESTTYQELADEDGEFDEADEIHIDDDGNAVLVYEDDEEIDEFTLGADVSQGLAHLLIADDADDGDEDVTGGLTTIVDRETVMADGFLEMDRPSELADLSVSASGELTDESNEFDASVYALFGDAEDDGHQQPAFFENAHTQGHVDVTADSFATAGTVDIDLGETNVGDDAQDESLQFSLSETNNGYSLEGSESQAATEFTKESWETEAQAKEHLEAEYAALASNLGGSAHVTIDHHSFDEQADGTYWYEVDYTIKYEGIAEGIEQMLTAELAADPTVDLTEQEAEALATQVTALELETIEFGMTAGESGIVIGWNVEINEYDEMVDTLVEIGAATAPGDEAIDELEDYQTMLDAQEAADLKTTLEWDGSIEVTAENQFEIEGWVTSDTENWGAYTTELEERDLGMDNNEIVFEFNAETIGDELHVDGEFEIEIEDVAQEALSMVTESLQQEVGDSSEASSFISALEDSELDIARMDVNFDSSTIELEASAKFEDTESMLEEGYPVGDDFGVTEVVGQTEDGGSAMYVFVENTASESTDATAAAELNELGIVGDQTEIYLPGESDRSFPSMDVDVAADHLGIELSQDDESDGEADDGSSDESGSDGDDSDSSDESDEESSDESDDDGADDQSDDTTSDDGDSESDDESSDSADDESDDESDGLPGFGALITVTVIGALVGTRLVRQE